MFKLTYDQTKKSAVWIGEHTCKLTRIGAIGGKITYSFTPTRIGITQVISCACGEELDLTDYDSW